jgi:pimeloyl-ACP methyl ester carboxylesterase
MATFVLVHGAGTGGYIWRRVLPFLRTAGHEVYAPTLTGTGERLHLAGPEIGLEVHIQDVAGVLEWEDLYDVALVGHSYGGMVISGVAERMPERLGRLIYLDAFVPRDGESMLDQVPAGLRSMMEEMIRTAGGGTQVPPIPQGVASFDSGSGADEEAQKAQFARRVPMSVKTATETVRIANPAAATLPRAYIYCNEKPANQPLLPALTRIRNDPAWRYEELPTGHFPHVTRPRALSELLLDLVEAAESSSNPARV